MRRKTMKRKPTEMDMVERVRILRAFNKKMDVFRKAMRCRIGGALFDGVLLSHDFQVYEMNGNIPQYVIDYCDNILMEHVRAFPHIIGKKT